jgi:threonine dehydratase
LHDCYLVDEQEIADSVFLVWQNLKIYVETSGAIVLGALLKNKHNFKNKNIGLIMTGGNVDLKNLLPFI